MILGRKLKLGRIISEITVGEKFALTEKVEDQDLLLYLGLTDDANPLYIQHDYASQTPYKRPIVPHVMLLGMISSTVSKYFPGPGSYINRQSIQFVQPVYHYEIVQFLFVIEEVREDENAVHIAVEAHNEKGELVLQGTLEVSPPKALGEMDGSVLDNF